MREDINYKLPKSKNLYVFLLVVLIIVELFSFVLVEQKIERVVDNKLNIKQDINLNTIIKELQENEINIVNMNKKSQGYEFKVMVVGTKEEVKKKVDELDNFNIRSYELDVKGKLIKGTLTISTIS